MRSVTGYAAFEPDGQLRLLQFTRRDLRPDDVAVRVTHVRVCHSDLHAIEALAPGAAPLVPGHEFVGEVTEVGPDVTRFRVGDAVAVGNIANHPERMALLERQCAAIEARLVELRDDLAVVQAEIETYRDLIARGLDCEDELPDDLVEQVRADWLLTGTLPSVPRRQR